MPRYQKVFTHLYSRLGAQDVRHGEVNIVKTQRRTRPEPSYGFLHFAWLVALLDGTLIASVPPGIDERVANYIEERAGEDIAQDTYIAPLRALVDASARELHGRACDRHFADNLYAADLRGIARDGLEGAIRIADASLPCAGDVWFPEHCLPDGLVYGVVQEGAIVSIAYAHRTGEYQDIVADIGVETSAASRKRGYARACVASVAGDCCLSGGESIYSR